ncbi:hypothetical protein V8D89_003649 [Ganoderma adspersum]
MKLTYDTLLHIISLSRYAKDTVQLMASCRVLNHEGPKIALKKPVSISTEEQLASFLKFLRADNLSRCRYLRKLEISSCFLEQDIVQELFETLPLLVNIEYLRLIEVEELLDLHPDLTPAFGSLTSLRHIDFTGVKGKACSLLLRLHSPLVSANVSFISDDDLKLWDYLDDDEWEGCHPAMLLDNFVSTLEELQCVAWYTIPDPGPDETLIPALVYPNMRKLSIELHHFPLRIDPFIRAFPNLVDLYINTDYHGGRYSEDIRDSHDTNVAQQLDPVNSCGTWAQLEHFRGCLFDLYAIGLTSHIRRVTIVDRLDDGPRTDMLATVLRYARPLHLKLEGITSTMLGDTERGFISMLHHTSASSLLNLDVCVYFGKDDREKDLSLVINNLMSALAGLPLKFLELRFETHGLDPTLEEPGDFERMIAHCKGLPEPPEPVPAPLTPAELSLETLDMDALVARLETIPSLEAAHVVLPASRYEGDCHHDRMISKGGSRLGGREQWESWTPGKNQLVLY